VELVHIQSGGKLDISLLKGILEENGIKTIVKSNHGQGFVIRAGNLFEEYHLFVQAENEVSAKELASLYSK